jgi:hypothetical protein
LLNPESRVPQLLAKDRRQVLQEADRINFALVIDISQKQIGLDLTKVILNRNQQNAVNIILGAEIPCPALADFLERAQVQQAGQKGPVDVDRRNVAQVQFPASNFSLANLSIKQVLLPLGICNCHVFKFGMITA